MRLVSPEKIREIDEYAIKKLNIPAVELMALMPTMSGAILGMLPPPQVMPISVPPVAVLPSAR